MYYITLYHLNVSVKMSLFAVYVFLVYGWSLPNDFIIYFFVLFQALSNVTVW